ncbi:glycerate kinase [Luteipulveratus mongoliensis]|uniref:Glycerate kinase n=1 Tax=Luteipulveratus mongoliensis TaxID=571913 RepID=A0A0K1JKQ4_9MICO|nr:glycerate kinase [Luteipulveratus mongoliensis]AKU17160.1 hypothetical protein VV02_17020 [Luteipulveratus mongoliensis]
MKVLVATTSIGDLDPVRATQVIGGAWTDRSPHVTLTTRPMSAGGGGFVSAVGAVPSAEQRLVVHDDEPVTVVRDADGRVYVEAAQVLAVRREDRSSYALGQVLAGLVADGVTDLVVGVGDVTCLDGGLGMLQALVDGDAPADDLTWLDELRDRLRDVRITAAVDDNLPLLGFHGAAASAGLDAQEAQAREQAMGAYVDRARRVVPAARDLLTGNERRLDREPGAGAGGGLAYGLLLLGGRLREAPDVVAEVNGLEEAIAAADLVVTGETVFDWRSLEHSVLARVSRSAAAAAKPVVVLAHEQQVGRREAMSLGIAGTYSVIDPGRRGPDRRTGQEPEVRLASLVRRVAGTWTPA